MTDWSVIAAQIGDATRQPFEPARTASIGGGYTNQTWQLTGRDGRTYFVKLNAANLAAMYAAEAAGLQELADSRTVRVPQVITHGSSGNQAFLVMEYFGLHGRGKAALLGQQLAALHRVHGRQFGWHRDNTLGLTPQRNTCCHDWLSFWREHRLGFQLELAARNGYRGRLQKLGQQVLERLPELLAGHQPAPSLLHGDLWGGNHAYLGDGTPVIFDPATYYGDREADLAMTELFGGFDAEFYAAYHAAYPLDEGYERRKTLYNLYHILNHCNMLGSGYLSQAEGMMQRLLA